MVKKQISLFEIFILVIAIVAFGWMVGSEVEVVSADGDADAWLCADRLLCTEGETCCYDYTIRGICKIGEDGEGYGWESYGSCGTGLTCRAGACITNPGAEEDETPKDELPLCVGNTGSCQSSANCENGINFDASCPSEEDVCCNPVSQDFSNEDSFTFGDALSFGGGTVATIGGGITTVERIGQTKTWNKITDVFTGNKVNPGQEVASTASTTASEVTATGTDAAAITNAGVDIGSQGFSLSAAEVAGLPTEAITSMGTEVAALGEEGILSLSTAQVEAISAEGLEALSVGGYEVGAEGTLVATGGVEATFGMVISSYASAAIWAAAVAVIVQLLADNFASQRNAGDLSTVAWVAAGAATAVVGTINLLIAMETISISSGPIGWVAGVIVLVAVGTYMLTGYQLYSRQIYTYTPSLWQAPIGGSDCEECNDLKIAGESICSKYICKSYGAACEWVNDETNYETCTEIGQGDRSPPEISPLEEAYGESVFLSDQYNYAPRGHSGVRITYSPTSDEAMGETSCVPAFTPLTLAVETDENAHCKLSLQEHSEGEDQDIFDAMFDMNEGSVYTRTHTLDLPPSVTISTDGQESQGYTLSNGGIYQFYIRCQDVRGNLNRVDFSMGFCVDDGPDMKPPKVIGSNPPEDSYLPRGIQELESFQVFTNEPADCKWGFQPKRYDYLDYDFEECPGTTYVSGNNYGCKGTITGLKDEETTTIYVACKDQPWLEKDYPEKRNRGDTYDLTFKGSRELIIEDITINGEENGSTIKGSTEHTPVDLVVNTFGGAEEGKSICTYGIDGTLEEDYAFFYNEGERSYIATNTEPLFLAAGDYKYGILCEDIAGNAAKAKIEFSLEVDSEAPQIVRIYKQGSNLNVITNEESECFYSSTDSIECLYDMEEDGLPMSTIDGFTHEIEWNTENTLYIKCMDQYGKKPDLDKCSLVARPFDIPEVLEAVL